MKTRSILGILVTLLFSVISGLFIGHVAGLPPLAAAGVIFSASYLPLPDGVAMAGILLKQAFLKDLQKVLVPANDFFWNAKNDSSFVENDIVNLPHAGTLPTVAVDRSTKGTATKRTDSATKYALSELSTDPTWLQYSEELMVAYDKRSSILEAHADAINKAAADYVLYKWAFGGDDAGSSLPTVVRCTTATERASSAPGATGTRKGVAYVDVLKVVNEFNKQNIPWAGRFGIINPDMFNDLLLLSEFKSSDYNNKQPIVDAPLSFYWMGINWFVRSSVNNFTTAGVLRAVGNAGATTDCSGGLFWHKDFVRVAKGSLKVFLNLDDAELYGSKMSAALRFGGMGANATSKGIINLVEGVTG
jgi:hypothetical protein